MEAGCLPSDNLSNRPAIKSIRPEFEGFHKPLLGNQLVAATICKDSQRGKNVTTSLVSHRFTPSHAEVAVIFLL